MQAQGSILLDVLVAALLAGVVGIERELRDKPAGLRTQMIIGAVAALFVELGKEAVRGYSQDLPPDVSVAADPIRVFEAIVVGVSFIGAGTIMRGSNGDIHYLTTAASLLLSAGIGISVGFGLYYLAAGLAAFALSVNLGLLRVSEWLNRKKG